MYPQGTHGFNTKNKVNKGIRIRLFEFVAKPQYSTVLCYFRDEFNVH